jgi:predicted transcriptional regulator
MNPLQVRMAIAGLRLTNRDLAAAAKVSTATLFRLDQGEELKARTMDDIRRVLEEAGARFVEDGDMVGVMVRKPPV